MLGFIKGQFGRFDNKAAGYSLRVRYHGYPGMDVRYVEGSRTMTVFGELMANLRDLHLDLSTFGRWDEPYGAEPIDEAHLKLVLDRMVSGLSHMGYIATPIGHSNIGGPPRYIRRDVKRSGIRRPRRDARQRRDPGKAG